MKKKRCRDGVTCVVICVACTLPSIYLVCVVFGTAAIPTSLNIFGKCLHVFSPKCSPDVFRERPRVGRTPPRGVGPQKTETEEVVAPPPAEASSDAG